ncbi:response regulator [Shinella sp. CPCC 101442]|uniref:response regulator n=1 Tax=Shinella sp. CPCC 101442 TaxID=2932265 RepID=UPI00215390F9|nr:response regulator [Shinella sp. CPCC 101442]MCR6502936.1 response regulator [Shinella sp. CPCC 101442]
MAPFPHIVVTDDNADIRELLADYLGDRGFRVDTADGGPALRQILQVSLPDLIVLDIMMPGEDGLTLCRDLRANMEVPILFLTARTDETDRIIGLELGADDYLVKPFNPRELLARIKAILRRVRSLPPQRDVIKANFVHFGQWRLDTGRRELVSAENVGVPLSSAEFRLLKAFIDHPGIVLSRDQLLDLTAGRIADPFDRAIDNQVSRLRKKIEVDPKNPEIIRTHWGGGYSFMPSVAKC